MTPKLYIYAAIALLLAGLTLALKVQTSRLHAAQDELAAFVAKARAEGEAQEARTKQENDRHRKEKDDADKKLAAARADVKRLRADNSGSRHLSGPPPLPQALQGPPVTTTPSLIERTESLLQDFEQSLTKARRAP